jgi:hypothetical protein
LGHLGCAPASDRPLAGPTNPPVTSPAPEADAPAARPAFRSVFSRSAPPAIDLEALARSRGELEEAYHRADSGNRITEIWTELARVERRAGNGVVALSYDERARALREALNGKDSAVPCNVKAHRRSTKGLVLASWQEVWRAALDHFKAHHDGRSYESSGLGASPTESRIRDALVVSKDDLSVDPVLRARSGEDTAWIVHLEEGSYGWNDHYHLVARRADSKLVLFPEIAWTRASRCGEGARSIALGTDVVLRVAVESETGMVKGMCTLPDGKLVQCSGAPNEQSAGMACGYGTSEITTRYFDVEKGVELLELTETIDGEKADQARRVARLVQRDGVRITGGGCERKEAF